jgi:N-acetylmuramoyl-L-alanine amidase
MLKGVGDNEGINVAMKVLIRVAFLIIFLLPTILLPTNLLCNDSVVQPWVALDVGHTYKYPGAISASGVGEIYYNEEVALGVRNRLEDSGIPLIMIEDQQLRDRPKIANREALSLVSIHHDGVTGKVLKQRGFSIFISKINPKWKDSLRLAQCIGSELVRAGFDAGLYFHNTKSRQRQLVDKKDGVYRCDRFVVLKDSKIPAVLIECGVISNPVEEERLNEKRAVMSAAIALGIQKYLGRG